MASSDDVLPVARVRRPIGCPSPVDALLTDDSRDRLRADLVEIAAQHRRGEAAALQLTLA